MAYQRVDEPDEPGTAVARTSECVPQAKIMQFEGGWHAVTYQRWQVSVAPDSLIMLPRHLKPTEVEDFIAAVRAAAEVGLQVKAANEFNAQNDDRSLARRTYIAEGGVPPGAVRMPFATNPGLPAKSEPRGFTPEALARARASRQTGPQPAGTQGQPQRPRVPLPPASPRPSQ